MANASEERRQRGIEDGWICVGAFAGAHGVRGDVRLKSFTDVPSALFAYPSLHKGANGPALKVKLLRDAPDGFIVRVDGVMNREDAQALKGTRLYVSREALEAEDEDEFYLADLIGLEARDASGAVLGIVRAVENFGAEDLLELVLTKPLKGLGRHAFIPFRKAYVPVVDIRGGFAEIAFDDWVETHISERDPDDMEEGAK
ncbi:ribosome maturation factor RimM [Kordiimonas lacus]|uniref:Ribosome maturation factor RimM n=1 Tax=Kordiimonas lacus TaxID=637679 RepID=A0A1G6ZQH0_9PROT|nr:ribosome maturation factor RimM [Kordiimonas lacus]SDE04477.1 16S rRNA processing protein RimM [Kordiimonas lacus]